MAQNRKEHPTLAAHMAEAAGTEREIETSLAAHLLLVSRAKHHARLERHVEASKARVQRLEDRLGELGGSTRSVSRPARPAKQVKGAAKTAEERATKIATGSAKKVRDAAELRRVLEAPLDEQKDACAVGRLHLAARPGQGQSGQGVRQARQGGASRAPRLGGLPDGRAQGALQEAGEGRVRRGRAGSEPAAFAHRQARRPERPQRLQELQPLARRQRLSLRRRLALRRRSRSGTA